MQAQAEKLRLQIETLPARTGVYLFKDAAGGVLYVGKATNLKARVRSHFQDRGAEASKARLMTSQVSQVEVIATDSELEALILESNLIKRYRPAYNVRLRDDKKYPYLKITVNEEFPALVVVRDMNEDGARYFGPYASTRAMWETVRHVTRTFKIRPLYLQSGTRRAGCPWRRPKRRKPCLYYHIGECSAPCDLLISAEDYRNSALQAAMFLEGRSENLLTDLRERMGQHSRNLQFEAAARIRNQLQAIERTLEQQKIVLPSAGDADVLGVSLQEDLGCVAVLQIRRGRLIGQDRHVIEGVSGMEEEQALSGFMEQHYQRAAFVPSVVLVPIRLPEAALISRWLQRREAKARVAVPHRGVKKQLVDMAHENARVQLQQLLEQESLRKTRGEQAIADLAKMLGLPRPPRRIEAFDISTIAGSESVGSMVVLENGEPRKSDYRRFKVRLEKGAPDDFAMMREVLERRLRATASPKFAKLPDLLLVDGGKPQLTAALKAMSELSLSIPCAALAKQHEEIFVPGKAGPVILPAHSRALHLLQSVRDEAHRFAQAYHHVLRSRQARKSLLDEIPGIGPHRKAALLSHFRSIRRLREASAEEIAAVPGIGRAAAQIIVQHLKEQAVED
jgi:excinuclease ABC subunit C